jgi:catechol 2,3-dioxygenase-like lactoylglutathione lyase family enzyme
MTIVSPLLPQLGVVDAGRSVTFYRDVLGFKVNWEHQESGKTIVAELELGAGKLQVGMHDGVKDTPEQRSARHSTICFFETDNVEALHAGIVARGGMPSGIEEVDYWMRMRLFEISDPDHHELWFGQRVGKG